jgi:hypothetical protein
MAHTMPIINDDSYCNNNKLANQTTGFDFIYNPPEEFFNFVNAFQETVSNAVDPSISHYVRFKFGKLLGSVPSINVELLNPTNPKFSSFELAKALTSDIGGFILMYELNSLIANKEVEHTVIPFEAGAIATANLILNGPKGLINDAGNFLGYIAAYSTKSITIPALDYFFVQYKNNVTQETPSIISLAKTGHVISNVDAITSIISSMYGCNGPVDCFAFSFIDTITFNIFYEYLGDAAYVEDYYYISTAMSLGSVAIKALRVMNSYKNVVNTLESSEFIPGSNQITWENYGTELATQQLSTTVTINTLKTAILTSIVFTVLIPSVYFGVKFVNELYEKYYDENIMDSVAKKILALYDYVDAKILQTYNYISNGESIHQPNEIILVGNDQDNLDL